MWPHRCADGAGMAIAKGEPCNWCDATEPAAADVLTDAYADGRRDEQEELASVLPGTTYMDPPDGGAPTILEQLQRQALDARRYLWLRENAESRVGVDVDGLMYGRRSLDAAIDAAAGFTKKD
jgi:hypothetical protein